ncbi:phospholipase D family protein [Burkholderia cepacia]|uniref:phospholipase D family protein n=1 Tax=Burkholderia cepacia TaxID=292 RepID=UPI00177FE519|nr:phospholipase D family protein [Burkholderia cepacia]
MKFVAGPVNEVLLRDVLYDAISGCTRVRAAVAYANANSGPVALFEACKQAGKPLTYYGRYDYTVPVAPEILEWFLVQRSADIVCRLVPDILHAKVIWWEGVGAYIGSANLSDRAWNSNIEAGVFVDEADLDVGEFRDELETFFDTIEEYSTPLKEEHISHLKQARYARVKVESSLAKAFEGNRKIDGNEGLYAPSKKGKEKRRAAFIKEWDSTLQLMRDLATRVSQPEHRPDWITPSTPKGLQVDQFLHAFYYQRVRDGTSSPFERLYQQNRQSRETALSEALIWWKNGWKWTSGGYHYDAEEAALQRAPGMQARFSRAELRGLTAAEFAAAAQHVYALREYAHRQSPVDLGLAADVVDLNLKSEAFARLQYTRESAHGKSILETLDYVLYGGQDANIAPRLWDAVDDPRWQIDGMGISTLGEIVGWALPDRFPPRNGRTSKALRALGYDVSVRN